MGPSPDRALAPKEFVEECYAFKRDHAPRGAFMRKLVAGKLRRDELLQWMKEGFYYTEPAEPNIAAIPRHLIRWKTTIAATSAPISIHP